MSVTEKGRPAHGTAASAPPRPGYGMPTRQERGQSLRSTATNFPEKFQETWRLWFSHPVAAGL